MIWDKIALKITVSLQLPFPHIQDTGIYGKFPSDKSMFDRASIPDDFVDAIRKSSDLFLQLQENVIENNLHYFHEPLNPGDQKDLTEIQRQVAEHYIKIYKV